MQVLRFGGGCALAVLLPLLFPACGGGAFTAGQADAGGDGAPADGTTGDSSGDQSTPGDAGDATAPGDGPVEASSGVIVYVSPGGADVNTGLSQAAPKRTIASALAEARTLTGVPEVHVCAGAYAETKLTISTDVVLRGAYSCTTWERTSTYGFPGFDGTNTTSIQNAQVSSQASTLLVTGAVTSATLVDGFVLVGGASSSLTVQGVHVASGASPVLKNDVVLGGAGAGGTTATGSTGILVDGTSAPEITECSIDGGSGSGATGSVGVDLNTTGAVSFHDASVTGGTGTLATSNNAFVTVGVRIRASLAPSTPLVELVIAGTATGGSAAGPAGKTVGVYVEGAGVSAGIALSDISGGTSTTGQTLGVSVTASGGTIDLLDDRIYGGVSTASPAQTYGVYVSSAASVLVANSMIHSGTVPPTGGSYTVGVDVSSVTQPTIVFDTIYTGSAAGTAIALNGGVTAAVLSDDLLVGSESALGSYGVATTDCSTIIGTLDHTAFANFPVIYTCPPADGGSVTAQTISDLAADLGAGPTAGDLLLAKPCTAATGCVTVAGCPALGETCQMAIFGSSWTADGVSSLMPAAFTDGGLAGADWALAPGSPCALTKGGVTISSITTDIDTRPRSASTPTIGAVEYDSATACQ